MSDQTSENVVRLPRRAPSLFDRVRDDDKHKTLMAKMASGAVGGKLELETNAKGKVQPTQANVRRFLNHCGVALYYNEFSLKVDLIGVPRHSELSDLAFGDIYTALDYVGIGISESKLRIILKSMAREHAYDPLLDHINGLRWDGEPRLDRLLVELLGADDNGYARAVTAAWCIGAVRRLRQPGCKHDAALLLTGLQDLGKSLFFHDLAYDGAVYTDGLPLGSEPKKVNEQMPGKWIAEFGEVVGINRREDEEIKLFLSRRIDEERAAYGHTALSVPRRFVFGATSNEDAPLKGSNGNRRWWVIKCHTTYDSRRLLGNKMAMLNQVWAEAAAREAKGEPNWLVDDAIKVQALAIQHEATSISPMQQELEDLLRDAPDDCLVLSADLYRAVGLDDVKHRTNAHTTAINGAMKRLGFVKNNSHGRGFLKGAARQHVAQWTGFTFKYLSSNEFAALRAENDD